MKDNKNNPIGSILRKYRIQNGLTQEQVAEKTGIAPKYLSQLERGVSYGSIETIIKFCDFYNITPNIILSGLLKNPTLSYRENFTNDFNTLNSTNQDIVTNLINHLLKMQNNNLISNLK